MSVKNKQTTSFDLLIFNINDMTVLENKSRSPEEFFFFLKTLLAAKGFTPHEDPHSTTLSS